MSKKKTRRETLGIIGAAGLLAACSGTDEGGGGPSGSSTGSTSAGTGGAGGAGTGSTGQAGTGTGSGSSGGPGTTSSGAAGSSTSSGGPGGSGGSGGSGGAGGDGTGSGGAGPGGAGGNGPGGAAGTGNGGSGMGGSAGRDGGRAGSGGSGADAGIIECKTKLETTVGPFPNIMAKERRDVRNNSTGNTTPKGGAQLTLRVRVYDLSNNCAPIPDAIVDIWACDAVGDYSGYSSFGTAGQDFCRGYQRTNAQGTAEFLTIFPGSYSGRAIHIHFSIMGSVRDLTPNSNGRSLASIFVGQLYFLRANVDEVFAAVPIYQQGARITPNDSDGIFSSDGGKDLIVSMMKDGAGYIGEIALGVRRADIGK